MTAGMAAGEQGFGGQAWPVERTQVLGVGRTSQRVAAGLSRQVMKGNKLLSPADFHKSNFVPSRGSAPLQDRS